MRGALSYEEINELSLVEKQIIGDFIGERLEKEFKKKDGNFVY